MRIVILRALYFPVLLIVVIWVSYWVMASPSARPAGSYLQIEVVPISGTSVKLDGRGVRAGKIQTQPGPHILTVTKGGFGSESRTVSVSTNQTLYVGIALQPNASNTQNWYVAHPSDQSLAEGIGSHEADYESKTSLQNNPFIGQLPLVYGDGQGGTISIAQGVPLTPGGLPAIYVTAATPSIRQQVLSFIRNHGYDPATMDLVFYGQFNPLDTSGD